MELQQRHSVFFIDHRRAVWSIRDNQAFEWDLQRLQKVHVVEVALIVEAFCSYMDQYFYFRFRSRILCILASDVPGVIALGEVEMFALPTVLL